ncbi:MAG: signal peptidase I [Parcubacteria group bacterium]|nr:signal peptidase I [Parcubacteria group bacterium]
MRSRLTTNMDEPNKPNENFFVEIVKFSVIAIIIVAPIRIFIAQPFIVSGASMDPTFETGQYLIIDQLSYRFDEPKRGDVVVFRFPPEPSTFFIKRIAGLPNETLKFINGELFVENADGESKIDEPYISKANFSNDTLEVSLSEDEYYVLGDNRKGSSDSRIWGTLPKESILGRAFIRLLPITKAEILPGSISK